MDEEYLSSPVQLVSDYLLYLVIVKEHYLRLHRNPVRRRSRDYRQVSRTQERELEGSRDRGGGQCQSVYRSLELAQLLLRTHTELLLLVYDQKSQILELKALSYEFVCTYDDIESTGLEPPLYIRNLFRSPQTAHIIDIARKILQTVLEGLEMLQRQDGGRNKDSDLLAVRHSLERSTDSNLSLSESHISAHKPVHRAIVLHVPLDGLNGLFLIRSILVHE